jgi:SchA/CurD like domain
MGQHFALMWDIKPGSEEAVADLFAKYGRPEHVVTDEDGNEKGKLLGTQVFLKGTTIVRVIEVEGSIADIAPHMARQKAIRELEEKLDEHIATPRDMSSPEGARKFFLESLMRPLADRRWDDEE